MAVKHVWGKGFSVCWSYNVQNCQFKPYLTSPLRFAEKFSLNIKKKDQLIEYLPLLVRVVKRNKRCFVLNKKWYVLEGIITFSTFRTWKWRVLVLYAIPTVDSWLWWNVVTEILQWTWNNVLMNERYYHLSRSVVAL